MNKQRKKSVIIIATKIFTCSVSKKSLTYKKSLQRNSLQRNFLQRNSLQRNSLSQKQGSALIIALVLMMFITTLGMLVLYTAHMMQALSIERSAQRPPQMLLESLIVYACQTQGAEWLNVGKKTTGTPALNLSSEDIHGTDSQKVEKLSARMLTKNVPVSTFSATSAHVPTVDKTTTHMTITQVSLHESYSTTLNGRVCTLTVEREKGGVVLRASCPGKRGVMHMLSAHLEAQGEQVVIRAWQRS
jgi:hypothetical protein